MATRSGIQDCPPVTVHDWQVSWLVARMVKPPFPASHSADASGIEVHLATLQSRGRPGFGLPAWVSPSRSLFIPWPLANSGNHSC